MENFTPISALIGGLMIGTAAVILMLFNGRVAGISGIALGLIPTAKKDILWRVVFIIAMIVSPWIYYMVSGEPATISMTTSLPFLIIGGFLVGFGTGAGSGCTSGHGVCGLARFSKRSLAATGTFMATAIITVYLVHHVFGGSQ